MALRQQRAAWAALAALGVLLTFAPAAVGLRTLSQRDTDQIYAPLRTLVVEELRHGRLPLWNPYEGAGKPLFAEGIHSVLHPVSLLGALVAPGSIDFLILAYLVAAALGAFLLASTLGASPPASAGAGLAFALSGYSVSMTGNLVFLAGLSTLPWLVAAARAAGSGHRWGIVLAGLATACAFFSGDAQVAIVGIALGLGLAADVGGARGAARALSGVAAGVLLAAVQILATRQILPLTARGVDLTDFEKTRWALAPARVLEWIIPGLFRGPPSQIPTLPDGSTLEEVFSESVYLGAPLLAAAALGLRALVASGRRRAAWLLGGGGAILLWLALGHHLGARQLLDWVPLWSRFRYTEKLMAPLALVACALAALGVDAFGASRAPAALSRAVPAAAIGAGAALLALALAPAATLGLATRLLGPPGNFYCSTLAAGLPHLLIAAVALLALDRLARSSLRTPALALLVALAPALAASFGAHLGDPGARGFPTPMRLASDSPVPRIAHPAVRASTPDTHQDHVDDSAAYRTRLLVPALNVAARVDTVMTYGAFGSVRFGNVWSAFGDGWARAFRRFALTHLAIPLPHNILNRDAIAFATDGATRIQRDEGSGLEVWSVPHRPWAFFPPRALAAGEASAALDLLLALAERPDDGTVVLEAWEPPPTSAGRVLQAERSTGTLRILAESQGPALLVVQEAFWPGWRSYVDGQPVETLAADYLVRAVRWPAGRHTLVMTYDPPEVSVGIALSALGALLLLGLALRASRRSGERP